MAKRRGEDPDVLHRKAQAAILSGLAGGNDDVFELMVSVLPYDVRGHFTPDVALLEVAAAALGLACPPGSERLEYEGLTDRHLSDLMLDGRTVRRRTQYAVYAAACMRGGLHPDLLGEAVGGSRGSGRTPSRRSSSTSVRPRTEPAERCPRSR
jgi:hypothetical protein